ncbi:MAG: hypothetical protein IAF58_21425, partial [Leptolyngbya sp.]|nr:hypothetical protein [Candidatus Melainabacteria bacterium]
AQQLLANPAFAPLLNKDDRELISAISKGRNDLNSPYYALYDKDGYITEARLNQLKLNPA